MSSPIGSVDSATEDSWPRSGALRSPTRVLVGYESSVRGRAALFHALDLAEGAGVPLTVASEARKEPVVGCARCRSNAVMWNLEMRAMAADELAEAARLVGPSAAVDYTLAIGDPVHALGQIADGSGADVIVVPSEPSGRIRRLFSARVAEGLSRAGRWEVIVAPAAMSQSRDGSQLGVQAGTLGSAQV
jgi:nucleotide-binding universal stress UspA family protein